MKRFWKITLVILLAVGLFSGTVAFAAGSPSTDSVRDIRDVQIVDMSAGAQHSLAVDSEGHVWSWGNNGNGQLGIGYNGNNPPYTFNRVENLEGIVAVEASGGFSLALSSTGEVWAWGFNGYGQLGTGNTLSSSVPVKVNGLSDVISISAGGSTSMALTSSGDVWMWGYKMIGDLSIANSIRIPTKVESLSGIKQIEISSVSSAYALTEDGDVYAWGRNPYGQLGIGNTSERVAPVRMQRVSNITAISAGSYHFTALKEDGTVWVCGRSNASAGSPYVGLLDPAYSTDILIPIQRSGLTSIDGIYAGHFVNIICKEGVYYGWGYNMGSWKGTAGVPSNEDVLREPVEIDIQDVNKLFISGTYGLAIKNDGSVWGWGDNSLRGVSPEITDVQITSPTLIFAPNSPIDPPDPTKHTVTVIERFLDGSPDITSTYDVTDGDPFAGTYASTGTIKSFNVSAANAEVHADFEDRTLSIAKVDRDITITLVFGESGTVTPPGQNEITVLTVDSLTSTINQGSNTITFDVSAQDLTNGRIEGDITDLWAGSDTIVFIIADGTEHPRQLGDLVYINDGDQVYVANDKIYTISIRVVDDPQPSPYGVTSAPDDEVVPASEGESEPPVVDPVIAPEADIAEPEEPETIPEPEADTAPEE